jgi:hypothetical protein
MQTGMDERALLLHLVCQAMTTYSALFSKGSSLFPFLNSIRAELKLSSRPYKMAIPRNIPRREPLYANIFVSPFLRSIDGPSTDALLQSS